MLLYKYAINIFSYEKLTLAFINYNKKNSLKFHKIKIILNIKSSSKTAKFFIQ